MKKPVIISLVALIGVVLVAVTLRSKKGAVEPIHEGKRVSVWVSSCVRKPGNVFSGTDEDEVLRVFEIGSNAVPYLLKAIEQDSGFIASNTYKMLYSILPAAFSSRLASPVDKEIVRFRAYYTLKTLGPAAKPAVPFLGSHFKASNPQLDWIREALSGIGPEAKEVIPILTNAIQNTNQTFRWMAARTLAKVDPNNPELVPTMLEELKSTNAQVRCGACLLLGQLGTAARSSIPGLTQALEDEDRRVREIAESALRAIQSGYRLSDRPPTRLLNRIRSDSNPALQ